MEIEEAITRAKKNDQKAFNYLLDLFWDNVYGFQLKRTHNENDAKISLFKHSLKHLIKLKPMMNSTRSKLG